MEKENAHSLLTFISWTSPEEVILTWDSTEGERRARGQGRR